MSLFDNQRWNNYYGYNPGNNPGVIQREIEAQNQVVAKWRPKVRRALKRSASQFNDGKDKSRVLRGNRQEEKLENSITSKIKKFGGVAELVTYNFERHGVFIHKGVGSGYQMSGGRVIRTAQTDSGTHRKQEEWFNPVLEKYMPELADNLAEVNANIAIAFDKARIK